MSIYKLITALIDVILMLMLLISNKLLRIIIISFLGLAYICVFYISFAKKIVNPIMASSDFFLHIIITIITIIDLFYPFDSTVNLIAVSIVVILRSIIYIVYENKKTL